MQAVIVGVSNDIDIFTYHDQCNFHLKGFIISTTLFYEFEYFLWSTGDKISNEMQICGSTCAIKLVLPLTAIIYESSEVQTKAIVAPRPRTISISIRRTSPSLLT